VSLRFVYLITIFFDNSVNFFQVIFMYFFHLSMKNSWKFSNINECEEAISIENQFTRYDRHQAGILRRHFSCIFMRIQNTPWLQMRERNLKFMSRIFSESIADYWRFTIVWSMSRAKNMENQNDEEKLQRSGIASPANDKKISSTNFHIFACIFIHSKN